MRRPVMKNRIVLLGFLVLVASAASHLTLRAEQAPRHPLSEIRLAHAPRTVWDSIYSDSQATRGQTIFGQTCVKCHGETLQGIDDALPLAGNSFLDGWNNKSVGSLYERISSSMPDDDPGSLTKQQVADVIAYMLRFNRFPAGSVELPTQADLLKEIMIVPAKP